MSDYRLSIEISREQQLKMQKLFPHGTKKLVFNLIIDDFIKLMERHGAGKVIGAFINRQVELTDLIYIKGLSNGDNP
jgi:hypothetical protein